MQRNNFPIIRKGRMSDCLQILQTTCLSVYCSICQSFLMEDPLVDSLCVASLFSMCPHPPLFLLNPLALVLLSLSLVSFFLSLPFLVPADSIPTHLLLDKWGHCLAGSSGESWVQILPIRQMTPKPSQVFLCSSYLSPTILIWWLAQLKLIKCFLILDLIWQPSHTCCLCSEWK